ncbi:MAG TPA: lytic transglycosylase domain-containing protein, partial [Nocardioides sp.]|nr:lytic transglycosylase domain-containing protein [Nocardioides sp.]
MSPTSAAGANEVVLASSEVDAPIVVRRSVTATVGHSPMASPHRMNGPTAVGDVVLSAYQVAATVAPTSCSLDVSLLAAIGQVESGNLAGRRLDRDHRPDPPVLGPVLNGTGGFAAIADTDGGEWDGDKAWDRAVGPLQFIPSTWRLAGVDLDGDGERNPQDIDDAAGAAMVYLCAGGADLSTEDDLRAAIFAYNHSDSYVELVLAWKDTFDTQGLDLATADAPLLDLDAVAYQEVIRHVDVSTTRTAGALKSSGTVKLANDASEAQTAAREQDDEHGRPGDRHGAGTKSTAASAGPSSPSGSSSAGGGPASATAGATPTAATDVRCPVVGSKPAPAQS